MSPAWQVLGIILGGVLSVIAAVVVARISSASTDKASDRATALGLVEQLMDRVEHVESRIQALEMQLGDAQRIIRAAATFIDRIGVWLESRRGPMPRPPTVLSEHIDTTLWVERPPDDGLPDD